jgi:hypothetical protein
VARRYELRFFRDVWDWIETLSKEDPDSYDHVVAALERLQDAGPAVRRPTVGTINGSRFRNLRELRPRSGSKVSIRMLFAFDPVRRAIFLVAGNKAEGHQWAAWYRKAVAEADDRYAAYLEAIERRDEHGNESGGR